MSARERSTRRSGNTRPRSISSSNTWGTNPRAGPVRLQSRLKKFGLIEYSGSGDSRRAKLTDLALDIILDTREDDSERRALIARAAMFPTIDRELLDEHPDGLPSEASLRFILTRERGFTPGAADELVRELRGTLEFAGIADGGATVSRQESDMRLDDEPQMTPPVTATPAQSDPKPQVVRRSASPQQRSVQLPVSGSSWVTLEAAFPLTEEAWKQMITLLTAMKPGLTTPE